MIIELKLTGLQVEPQSLKIYWSYKNSKEIHLMDLDGTNRNTTSGHVNIKKIKSFAIFHGDELYISHADDVISRLKTDGSHFQNLRDKTTGVLDMKVFDNSSRSHCK